MYGVFVLVLYCNPPETPTRILITVLGPSPVRVAGPNVGRDVIGVVGCSRELSCAVAGIRSAWLDLLPCLRACDILLNYRATAATSLPRISTRLSLAHPALYRLRAHRTSTIRTHEAYSQIEIILFTRRY